MADDGSILAEEKEEAEEAVNSSLPEWVTNLAIPALVVQARQLASMHIYVLDQLLLYASILRTIVRPLSWSLLRR